MRLTTSMLLSFLTAWGLTGSSSCVGIPRQILILIGVGISNTQTQHCSGRHNESGHPNR